MNLVVAGFTAKACLSGPIGPVCVAALAAALACISWVFFDDFDAGESCFVVDEGEELRGVNHPVDLSGHFDAIADAEELFDVQDAPTSGYGINDVSADAVVFAPDPSGFSSLAAFDMPTLRLRCSPCR